jgi:hypothetical protein
MSFDEILFALNRLELQKKQIDKHKRFKVFFLENCPHIFHGRCLEEYFNSQIEQAKFPICCPDLQCKKEVADFDLTKLLAPEMLDKYNERSFNKATQL